MAIQNNVPPFPNGEVPIHPPRSAALWLALMALHYLRFDYPSRNYFTDENLDAALTLAWVEYLEVMLDEMGV